MASEYDELKDLIVEQNTTAAVFEAVVKETLKTAADDRTNMRLDIKSIKKTVNGNGEEGLVGRMTVIEKAIAKWKDTQTWLVRLIISGILLAIIGATINHFL